MRQAGGRFNSALSPRIDRAHPGTSNDHFEPSSDSNIAAFAYACGHEGVVVGLGAVADSVADEMGGEGAFDFGRAVLGSAHAGASHTAFGSPTGLVAL